MKRTGLLPLASAVVALSLVAGCGESQPPAAKAPAPKAEPAQPAPPVQPVSTVAAWPPPAPPDTPVAANLLADNWEFVIDASGSMGGSACGTGNQPRMETAKSGVIAFSQSLPETANRGLVVFSERSRPGIHEWLKLGSGNRAEFTRLVSRIAPQGSTPLRSSIQLAAKISDRAGAIAARLRDISPRGGYRRRGR